MLMLFAIKRVLSFTLEQHPCQIVRQSMSGRFWDFLTGGFPTPRIFIDLFWRDHRRNPPLASPGDGGLHVG